MEVVITRAREAGIVAPIRFQKPLLPRDGSNEQPLTVTVLFTTIEATLPALEEAQRLAGGLGAEMCILMPQVVPYALPLDRPAVDPAFRVQQLCESIFEDTIAVRIEVHLCRDVETAVVHALKPGSLVVVGSRRRWQFRCERALVQMLRREGHQVVQIPNR